MANRCCLLGLVNFTKTRFMSTSNSKNLRTESKKEIPVVKGLPVVGTMFSILAAGGGRKLHEYIDKRHQQYGSVFREKLGPIDAIWISDPLDMKLLFAQEGKFPKHILPEAWLLYNDTYGQQRGLYFMDGKEWWKYRQIFNKVLLKDLNVNFIKSYKIVINDLLNEWELSNEQVVPNLIADLYKISISFMVAHLVGGVYDDCKHDISNDVNCLAQSIQKVFQSTVKFTVIPAKTSKLLKLNIWNDFVLAVDNSIESANNLVSKLMSFNSDGLLNSLLNAHDIPSDMIKRLIVDFIIAAGDTTAYSTQWSLYTLGLHKSIQNNLRHTLIETDFLECDYLNNILKEVLRMYPLAPFLARILPSDTYLTDHIIPANSLVVMSMFTSSRNGKYFNSPNEFIPDRWNRLKSNKYNGVNEPFATLPYGFGARSCIGQKMAHIQMCLTLAECIKRYNIETMKPVKIALDLITVPDEQISIKIQKL
ncbi:cytochrome P450 315a1, mitochondrial [Myzus persicae]|uniref:cytochrome P450 315a1, mitochondrial n=1 Tax=Myzus persicae TaxID=13164 RepID=UPI000B933ADC|nr:cytochrome P450 315a1, mitochondrial [Myzus persicae]XP_022164034.1 cytochrome P450 315a1, mitochondrial [Myzus persicae]XP_022164036.1 cytochrome P450 315a1, mitochondrial [Myzus persicae]XP_022164037.1 cytochrome P450 315a1, mitochondrial [Myzus persicae]